MGGGGGGERERRLEVSFIKCSQMYIIFLPTSYHFYAADVYHNTFDFFSLLHLKFMAPIGLYLIL